MGYRRVLGIVRCAEKYGAARTDAACERALRVCGQSAPHRKHIEAILQRNLDGLPEQSAGTRPRLHWQETPRARTRQLAITRRRTRAIAAIRM
jgi:hypothetical protein